MGRDRRRHAAPRTRPLVSRPMPRFLRAALLFAALAIAVAGCGSKKVSTAAIPSAPAPASTPATTTTPKPKPGPTAIKQKLPASDKNLSKKPKVPTPTN